MQFTDEIVNFDGINIKDFVIDIFDAIKKTHFEVTDVLCCSPDITNDVIRRKGIPLIRHSRPEILKKSRPKSLVKSNKSISRKLFDQIPFFAISKMAKNQFLDWGKV